jgi:hypothetical protein
MHARTAAHRRRVDHRPSTGRARKAAAETAGEASTRKASAARKTTASTTMEATRKASAPTAMETTPKASASTSTAVEAAAARKGIDTTRAQT